MLKQKNNIRLPFIVFISYIIMVITNSLANILPINGKGTGEISDSYQNLFAPAGFTFAIWGIIYLLLIIYTLYQLIRYNRESDIKKQIFDRVGILFSISSIANTIWIFAWHYDVIWLSLLLMMVILICLIKINLILKDTDFSMLENLTVKLPFTVYFGWITVATIANITIFLVSINWNRFSLSEVFWTDLIISVGAIIGCISVLFYKSFAYGIVLIWAYLGIALKHLSPDKFNRRYPSVIITVSISMVLIVLSLLVLLRIRMKENLNSN
ncbi:MAG: hypothetical protein ACERKN_06450 [Velocimicrobium sp.]